jgi:hypothetical protein
MQGEGEVKMPLADGWLSAECESLYWQVNVLAKRLTPERVRVEFEARRLHIVITSPEGELEFELDTELYDEVRAQNRLCLIRLLGFSLSRQPAECWTAWACHMPVLVHDA